LSELPADVCEKLKELINSTEKQDELECRKYLKYAEDYLFKEDTLKQFLYAECEVPTNMGKTDYVISGIIGNNPVRIDCVKAYVWEFKAPQCYMFRKDGENRLCPTKELFEAENQLLNYYHALKHDLTLVHRFKAGHPRNICLGGIIIGSHERLVRGQLEEKKKKALLDDAYEIRKSYFYKPNGLWLVTWDEILDFLSNKYVNLTKNSVDLEHTFEDYKLKEETTSVEESLTALSDKIDSLTKQVVDAKVEKIHVELYKRLSEYAFEEPLENLKDYLRKPSDIIQNEKIGDLLTKANLKIELEKNDTIRIVDSSSGFQRIFWLKKDELGEMEIQYRKLREELLKIIEARGISSEEFQKNL
jgi:hypothetical protein